MLLMMLQNPSFVLYLLRCFELNKEVVKRMTRKEGGREGRREGMGRTEEGEGKGRKGRDVTMYEWEWREKKAYE